MTQECQGSKDCASSRGTLWKSSVTKVPILIQARARAVNCNLFRKVSGQASVTATSKSTSFLKVKLKPQAQATSCRCVNTSDAAEAVDVTCAAFCTASGWRRDPATILGC